MSEVTDIVFLGSEVMINFHGDIGTAKDQEHKQLIHGWIHFMPIHKDRSDVGSDKSVNSTGCANQAFARIHKGRSKRAGDDSRQIY